MEPVGFTAPASAPGQAESHAAKAALDAWLATLEVVPAWHSLYADLLLELKPGKRRVSPNNMRWDWRKALFIAWSCLPARKRSPATLKELADLMGLTDPSTIRHWRAKDPEIDERIRALPVQLVTEHIADLLDAALAVALEREEKGFQDRKLLLEMAGAYKPRQVQELTGADDSDIRIRVVYGQRSDDPPPQTP
jgi:hypothetical protein